MSEVMLSVVQATKSVKQSLQPNPEVLALVRSFQAMTNECIRIGLAFEEATGKTPSMRKLSLLSYSQLKGHEGYSRYRLTAISKAAGILSARRKSIKRGYPTKVPYLAKPILVSCYGLKIEGSNLAIHLDSDTFESIPLNRHTIETLSDPALKVRSFTLTERSLSLCISKEVPVRDVTCTIGIDRNLRNVTVGNAEQVAQYDLSKMVEIGEVTRGITGSFRRNDVKVRQRISSKYGRRRNERTKRLLHIVTKDMVEKAKESKGAIVFEDIKNIRKLYQRGNGQAHSYRSRMNSIPWHELKTQVEYEAAWEGIPVITLTKGETRGTTMDCPRCGERLQLAARDDGEHHRMLWCQKCRRWEDRDVVAVMNISHRGRLRFDRSEGEAGEARKGNPEHEGEPVILRVDASKLNPRRHG